MSSLIEKLQREIEKGQAERATHELNIALDPNDPANATKIREAKTFQRKVGAGVMLFGLALIGLTYGMFAYNGDLYLVLGLFGVILLFGGLYQTIVGKPTVKEKK